MTFRYHFFCLTLYIIRGEHNNYYVGDRAYGHTGNFADFYHVEL